VSPLADLARAMFAAAVAAVQPGALVRRIDFLADGLAFEGDELHPPGRLVMIALGKAAPGLAAECLARSQRPPDVVFILAPDGVTAPSSVADRTRRASHPTPDERGVAASTELLDLLGELEENDGVVLLLSGGASALLARPLDPLGLAEIVAVTRRMLAAGADIHELNTVRKHVLAAAGGRLAAACRAPLLTLALSDVPGDDPSTIASGPTVADTTTFADAFAVLARHQLVAPFPKVARVLAAGSRGEIPESPKPGDSRLSRARTHLLGSSREALGAAAAVAERSGFRPIVLTRTLHGEARRIGAAMGGLVGALAAGTPTALLAAGETTVSVRGDGCGGRCLELALAAACTLAGRSEIVLLAGGTDGIDGSSPAAGAVVDGATLARAVARGRDAELALGNSDSWGFFVGLPEAIVTGPTGTNVADLVFGLSAGGKQAFIGAAREEALSVRAPG
jgi:glycerate 2-kinase